MDEDTVHLSDSDEAKASVSRLLKAIEGWATKESQKGEQSLLLLPQHWPPVYIFSRFTSKTAGTAEI